VLVGSFLHFAFEIANYSKAVALMAAVNESIWEHLKIGFWPAFIFAIFEYFIYGKKNTNFFFAKAINLYLIPVLIVVLFYSYTIFIENKLIIDILIFIVSIIVAYTVSFKILISQRVFKTFFILSILLIILEVVAFSLFTYFPFHFIFFKDPITSSFGIIN
jgi:hypothetical protein